MKKKKPSLFKRWLEKQFDKNTDKIRRCPDYCKKIFRKYLVKKSETDYG